MDSSPFLSVSSGDWIASNELSFAIFDRFPVTPGHSLVITKRLVPTWFDATPREQAALMELVNVVKQLLDERLMPKPDGYNIGFNCGSAAGQTVDHVHIHVIPRSSGDVEDPRGGVRYVIPRKANYLKASDSLPKPVTDSPSLQLTTGHPDSPLWEQLSWRIAGARRVDVLASFVQLSGLDVIEERLFDALRNGARVRILASDYLFISDPLALRRLLGWCELDAEDRNTRHLFVNLIEMLKIPSQPASFHPKAWLISDDHSEFISVGSSNLSKPALETGVEWNLLSAKETSSSTHAIVASEFENLWHIASPLTPELVEAYSVKAKKYRAEHFEPESKDQRETPLVPRPWQIAALESLEKIRDAGYTRALVAVATGMGKTWLAAFDARQVGLRLERRPRVLVIAHRAHILAQAEAALSRVLDAAFENGETAWYIGDRNELGGDLVIASVQKLSRPDGLERIAQEHFDYVIVDEVHHAHAPSYRRVLSKLQADFILGLTATPERTDGYDVVSIFDDNLAYHATIGDGITEESLVPFHYVGIKDTVDFRQIPWRNGRFDLAELEERVIRSERMDRLWSALEKYPAKRTLIFCCSRRHALFVRDWLRWKGTTSAAVFSGAESDSYAESLQKLRTGELQALCVVDMFNEGLDIPAVDRVVMLRPTESKVIFLQQLGRGLRASEGKARLLVIDFVGNHRIFAQRLVHLLSLASDSTGWQLLRGWLDGTPPELPPGCLLDVELDAKDMLRQFLPQGATAGIEAYRAIRDELARRPTILEMFVRGYIPKTISVAHGNWFAFAEHEGDLNDEEKAVVASFSDWFRMLETTRLNKSYKMVVLRVLLDRGQLFASEDIAEFSRACRRFMQGHQVLRRDLEGDGHALDHSQADDSEWIQWWIQWPIGRWLAKQGGKTWCVMENSRFKLDLDCPEQLRAEFIAMTEEIVDWRLAAYSKSRGLTAVAMTEATFTAKVLHAGGKPILFVPEKTKEPARPVGPTSVQLPNGATWDFKFVKVACNVAMPEGAKTNQLGSLLTEWFGPDAGLPGTNFSVRFNLIDGVWHAAPITISALAPIEAIVVEDRGTAVMAMVSRAAKFTTHVPVYDLVAAASAWGPEGSPQTIGWLEAPNHSLREGMFAAWVSGRSMEPRIPTGSWCLFRPCPTGSRNGKLVLVQVNTHTDPEDGGRYTVKKYQSAKRLSNDGWGHESIELQPLNPDPKFKPIKITADNADSMRIIGEFIAVLATDQY